MRLERLAGAVFKPARRAPCPLCALQRFRSPRPHHGSASSAPPEAAAGAVRGGAPTCVTAMLYHRHMIHALMSMALRSGRFFHGEAQGFSFWRAPWGAPRGLRVVAGSSRSLAAPPAPLPAPFPRT